MAKFEELLEKLQSLDILQKSNRWDEDIPEIIYNYHFDNNYQIVASKLDSKQHRWYETSTEVVNIYGKFLGIRHVSNSFSEEQDIEDCFHTLEFYEMEEIKITSYKIKL